jgi:hypothetical protein
MGEWRYISTVLDLGIRWEILVSVTLQPPYLRAKNPSTQ